MQSEFAPALTRLDALLWFLRVQLWLSVISSVSSLLQPYALLSPTLLVGSGIPILVLLLFPRILATNSVGAEAQQLITSFADLRALAGRCIGLSLLVGSLGWTVLYSCYLIYSLIPHVSSSWFFGSGLAYLSIRSQMIATGLRFFLGFVLAFGPAIRENFHSRQMPSE